MFCFGVVVFFCFVFVLLFFLREIKFEHQLLFYSPFERSWSRLPATVSTTTQQQDLELEFSADFKGFTRMIFGIYTHLLNNKYKLKIKNYFLRTNDAICSVNMFVNLNLI